MTRFTPLWLQAGSYAASVDRRLIGALYPDARSSGCALSTPGAMDVQVGAGSVAVPLAGGVGSVLCVSDDYETVTLDAAPASGVNRYDLIVCQAHGADIDAGADEFRFLAVKGADGGAVPATPANAAALGYVQLVGGSAAVDPAKITDTRPGNLAVPAGAPASTPRGLIAAGQGPAAALSAKVGALWTWAPGVTVYAGRKYQLITSWQWTASAANSFEYFVYGLTPNDTAVGGRRFWWITQAIAATNTFYGDNVTGYAPGATGVFSVAYSNNGAAANVPANGWRCWLYDVGGI